MNLTFDSVEDLEVFLHWADMYRAPGAPEPDAAPRNDLVADGMAEASDPLPTIDTRGIAFDTPPSEAGTLNPDPLPDTPHPAPPAEPAKRKRRTKAEIEADEKAAADAAAALAAAQQTGQVPAEGAQAPTGTNPFEQAAAAGGEAASEAEGAVAGEEPGETVVTPFQHLTRAREFIAKHGMPKYNESFTKAGLDANVMGYSAFQRALHMTALDELDKA